MLDRGIVYGSVCSGIEAASVAWHPLGWMPSFFSEIEDFPRAVLAERWPGVPVHGDFTTIQEGMYAPIDVLVGGTPCQDFSVAGLRAGLAGERGNLTLEFVRLAGRLRPEWVVWENVPGILSLDSGRAFGALLGGLAELGYGFAYRTLDAQFYGVPQRRRRIFVVGHLGDWRRAAAVLFERESLSWHPPPSREAGEGVAPTIAARTTGGGGLGTDFDCDGGLIARSLNGHHGRQDATTESFVTHTLRGERFDAMEDGTGRGTPLVPVAYRTSGNCGAWDCGDGTDALTTATDPNAHVIAFSAKDHGADASDISPTLRAGGFDKSHANAGVMPAVALNLRGREGGSQFEADDLAALRASDGGSSRSYVQTMSVRRLTPRECDRLQGFPDDYTLVRVPRRNRHGIVTRRPWAKDGPRYKALGNSMAVVVMRWIGERIEMVRLLV